MRVLNIPALCLAAACGDIPPTDEPASTTSHGVPATDTTATDITASSGAPTTDAPTSTSASTTTGDTAGTTGDASTTDATTGDDSTTAAVTPGCADPDGAWAWAWSSGGGRAIWGSAADDVWIVGPGQGEARRFDGSAWTAQPFPAVVPHNITGSAADDVYVAAIDGAVHRFDGASWQPDGAVMPTPALWSVGTGELFAVGDSQNYAVRQAGPWTTHPLATPAPLRALAGTAATDLHAVGDDGTALHFNGTTWTPRVTDTTADLHSVWPLAPGSAVAVGDAGVVLHLTPDGVVPVPPLPPPFSEHPLLAVWAADDTTLFIVSVQTLHILDDAQWLADPLPFFDSAAAVWGHSPHDIFIAGAQHATLHCHAR